MKTYRNEILCGDCIDLLNGANEPFADLVFADPPFNIGYQYDQYEDMLKKDKYLHWSRDWMAACVHVLKPHGSFYIAIGDEYAAHIRLIGDELGLHLRNWVIWHYTFGQQTKTKFARSHAHIFYFIKDEEQFTFNDWKIRLPSDRQLLYNDKRANATGKMPDDVWNTYSRVCGTFKERQGWHPCQMPELLLARIIAVSSQPGELVLDPFSGSGTTAAAAVQLGRDYCGIDISENYVKNSQKRLSELQKDRRSKGELGAEEGLEFRRLFAEMGVSAGRLLEDDKLLRLFKGQFEHRMKNGRHYELPLICEQLKEFLSWGKK
ncbi:MAG: site-specific DNA-methyltransferase [Planctomycetaceae bacterium]|nr:site-specific DNA-methyltransferase [Planctomycetaceae bacterium]